MADIQASGSCQKCGATTHCKYNHFEQDDLVIDSWEHKCQDCGARETTAFRSDDEDAQPENGDPLTCPYCGRKTSSYMA